MTELSDGNAPIDHATPAKVFGLGPGSGVVEVAAGDSFAMVRKVDGSVWAWGRGDKGELGNGTWTLETFVPVPVTGLARITVVGAGQNYSSGSYSAALDDTGQVWTWGVNDSGQLGDGSSTNSNISFSNREDIIER